MPDDRLAISVTHADGRVTRWGYDEVDGKNIPNDLTFSTAIPGGFKDASCSLLRRLDQDQPDQDLFDTITVHGPGGRVAWEGRMTQFPRSHGDAFRVSPGAVGWAAHLRDDPTFREIYIDQDITRWTPPSAARRLAMASLGVRYTEATVVNDTTNALPAIVEINEFPSPGTQISEMIYDAGPGLEIAKIRYAFNSANGLDHTNANWTWGLGTYTSDALTSLTGSSGDLASAASGSGFFTPATPGRVGHSFLQWGIAAAGTGQRFELHWQAIVVYGNHGLTLQESGGGSSLPGGYYASDVIADIVSRAAPLLTYTAGNGGSIQPTSFAIPHIVYRDPVTAEFAISDVNKYHLYDWGVHENREFFYRQPDPNRLCWEARLGDGAQMDADGLTAEQVINGVVVTYQDVAGVTKTVGPPSGPTGTFDGTDSALQDSSSSNPVNSHGIPAKPDNLSLSFPTTEAGAIQIGAAYLAERSLATRRGNLTLTGLVQHPTEGKVPVWRVRAGDWIKITDLNGENATVPRKIIETSYSHSGRSISLSLDNTVAKLDAILARVGVHTGIATGSGF